MHRKHNQLKKFPSWRQRLGGSSREASYLLFLAFLFPVYHLQPLLETGYWAGGDLVLTQDSCFDELPSHTEGSVSSLLYYKWFRLPTQLLERDEPHWKAQLRLIFLHSSCKDHFLRVPVLFRMNLGPNVVSNLAAKMRPFLKSLSLWELHMKV